MRVVVTIPVQSNQYNHSRSARAIKFHFIPNKCILTSVTTVSKGPISNRLQMIVEVTRTKAVASTHISRHAGCAVVILNSTQICGSSTSRICYLLIQAVCLYK